MNTNSEQPQAPLDDDFSHEIIGAAVEVQRVLGVGLLESAYASALAIELAERELGFQRDMPLSAQYKGHDLGAVYRADFIVESSVIVSLLAMDAGADPRRAQLLSALRLSNLKLGLLINFHAFPVVKGIHRVANRISGERA
ncbi:MAG: GxxExxY protein [Pseudomonadota bacterium]